MTDQVQHPSREGADATPAPADDAPADSPAPHARPSLPFLRIAAAVAGVAAILWVAQSVAVTAFVIAAFGGPAGLVPLVVVFALAWFAVAGALKLATRRWHVVLAGAAVVATTVALFLAVTARGIPIVWIALPGAGGVELAYPVIAAGVALWVGLLLGPRWSRVLAALLAVAAIAWIAWTGVQERAAEAAARDSVADAQREANFEYFLDEGVHPMTSDLAGSDVLAVTASGSTGTTTLVTAEGGVVAISVAAVPADMGDGGPCLWLASPADAYEPDAGLEEYSDFCVRDTEGWRRPDGTGVARIEGDRLVAVVAQVPDSAAPSEATRAGNAGEVAAVASELRTFTEDELRTLLADEWLG